MRTPARMRLSPWSWTSALVMALVASGPVAADPIVFSTSGRFSIDSGPSFDLAGVSNTVPATNVTLGTLPIPYPAIPLHESTFQLQFRFNDNLPPLTVSGTIRDLGYNFDQPIVQPIVSTTATAAQLPRYPNFFRDLISHPDWLHTSSFESDVPQPFHINASVHPEDPHEVRPVPEPSTVVAFGLAVAGVALRSRRSSLPRP